MALQSVKIKLTGISPLLMHSDRYANPIDKMTKAHKELTSKRKKTDEDHQAIMRSEWRGALYYDEKLGVYIPSVNIRSAMVEGAKLNKLGMNVKRGTMILTEREKLEYSGAKDPEKMYDSGGFVDVRSVVVGQSRLMRCRPIFREWSVSTEIQFDTQQVELEQIVLSLDNAGRLIGIGDFRPAKGGMYGRFSVEVVK